MNLVLGLWGSGEFEPWAAEPDAWLLEHASSGDGSVLVVPTASAPEGDAVFDRWARKGVEHYRTMGRRATALPLKSRADADRLELLAALEHASMVYFSGGNPAYLARALSGSAVWLRLLERMEQGMAYAGCSAGIVALGDLAADSAVRDFERPETWQAGLRLFPDLSFGAHWDALDRFAPGLKQRIVDLLPAGGRLLGIDEDTAVVGDGSAWRVLGSGAAHLYEGGRWSTLPAGATFELSVMAA